MGPTRLPVYLMPRGHQRGGVAFGENGGQQADRGRLGLIGAGLKAADGELRQPGRFGQIGLAHPGGYSEGTQAHKHKSNTIRQPSTHIYNTSSSKELYKCGMTPGARIEIRRKQLQLSQGDLAELIKTQQTQISRIELDEQSGRKHLEKIAKALDVPLSWITTGLPLQPWEGKEDSGESTALRATVTGIIARLQSIIQDLSGAISPSNAAPVPDSAQNELEHLRRKIAEGVRTSDARESAPEPAAHRSRSPRHRRRKGGTG